MLNIQNCEILKLDKNYRGELFPRELDNSALTVYINVSILAFPKVLNKITCIFHLPSGISLDRLTPSSFITLLTLC